MLYMYVTVLFLVHALCLKSSLNFMIFVWMTIYNTEFGKVCEQNFIKFKSSALVQN